MMSMGILQLELGHNLFGELYTMILSTSTKKDRVESQLKLKDLGFDPGPIDGQWGKKSEAAYEAYLSTQNFPIVIAPIADIPWWKTRRAQGLVTLLLGFAAAFIPGFESADAAQVTDIVWSNIESVEIIIQKAGEVIAAAGLIWSIIGARGAKAPIDPNLVAKFGETEIRLPKRTYTSADEVKTGNFMTRAKGLFSGD